ncbi:hypothetical protein N7481_005335 [Penicillium waksmanii]|uniref:uncharacterized protein n=1 Tax=Penicillium waksmanii TaxID=69791 RepID=UPI00254888A0|nr:uncharacterized protein N7481_005335 [Penicillium waksmanii]KAJ5983236.1 hypothetical protein N7481_005335 [Penicillium waksmanii]
MSRPSTLFGGALIGTSFTTAAQVQELLDQLQSIGINRIDTAARYSPTSPGSSERLLGEVRAQEQGFTIDTKTSTDGSLKIDGSGSLTAANITKSINDSFSRLHAENVHILYFHRPDPETPIAEQAGEIHRQYLEGRFEKFGLSNFPPDLVTEFIAVCEDKNYVKPSVYQGLYNLLSRESEKTLFPLLRKHGIAFNAYSPLAGGFLTGRATRGDAVGTRYAPEMHRVVADLLNIIDPLEISGAEACLRWLYYHSTLDEKDGVILGASKFSQIVQNMSDISKGPLPEIAVQKIDSLFAQVH